MYRYFCAIPWILFAVVGEGEGGLAVLFTKYIFMRILLIAYYRIKHWKYIIEKIRVYIYCNRGTEMIIMLYID